MALRATVAGALRHQASLWCSASSPSATLRRGVFSRLVNTLVVAEQEEGLVKQSSISAIEAAGAISHENSVSVLLAGTGPDLEKAASHAASAHPLVSQVLVADSDMFLHPVAETCAELVNLVHQKGSYSYIIAASNSFGKNIIPRAAALLDVSPITDVIEVPEPRTFVRPIYAGNALCTVKYTGTDPCMLTIRSTSFPLSTLESKTEAAPISHVDLSSLKEAALGKSRWLSLTSQETERPDLGNAHIVVTGGRGLKSAENFKLLDKLADKLGAAVGATRAAVDAGFVPNELQVLKSILMATCNACF